MYSLWEKERENDKGNDKYMYLPKPTKRRILKGLFNMESNKVREMRADNINKILESWNQIDE